MATHCCTAYPCPICHASAIRAAIETLPPARELAIAIANDVSGRCGLGDEWDMIDPETRAEIIDDWTKIIEWRMRRG